MTTFKDKAIAFVHAAVESDGAGNYEEALQHYKDAIACLLEHLKTERQPKAQEVLRHKVKEYLDRAEQLRDILQQEQQQQQVAAAATDPAAFYATQPYATAAPPPPAAAAPPPFDGATRAAPPAPASAARQGPPALARGQAGGVSWRDTGVSFARSAVELDAGGDVTAAAEHYDAAVCAFGRHLEAEAPEPRFRRAVTLKMGEYAARAEALRQQQQQQQQGMVGDSAALSAPGAVAAPGAGAGVAASSLAVGFDSAYDPSVGAAAGGAGVGSGAAALPPDARTGDGPLAAPSDHPPQHYDSQQQQQQHDSQQHNSQQQQHKHDGQQPQPQVPHPDLPAHHLSRLSITSGGSACDGGAAAPPPPFNAAAREPLPEQPPTPQGSATAPLPPTHPASAGHSRASSLAAGPSGPLLQGQPLSQAPSTLGSRASSTGGTAGMTRQELVELSAAYVSEAVACEAKGDLVQAKELYCLAAETLVAYMRMEQNMKVRAILSSKIRYYIQRGEELKEEVVQQQGGSSTAANSGDGGGGSGSSSGLGTDGAPSTSTGGSGGGGSGGGGGHWIATPGGNSSTGGSSLPPALSSSSIGPPPTAPPLVVGPAAERQRLRALLALVLSEEVPGVKWKDVEGLQAAKSALLSMVVGPLATESPHSEGGAGTHRHSKQQQEPQAEGRAGSPLPPPQDVGLSPEQQQQRAESDGSGGGSRGNSHKGDSDPTSAPSTAAATAVASSAGGKAIAASPGDKGEGKPLPRGEASTSHVLLYGPAGCGKAHLIHAAAFAAHCRLLTASCWFLSSKQLGSDCERLVDLVFEEARSAGPCILMLEGVDAFCRDPGQQAGPQRAKRKLVANMHELNRTTGARVCVMAATCEPYFLDDELQNAFDTLLWVPPPDAATRAAILKAQLSATPCSLKEDEVETLAATRLAGGYSCTDVMHLVTEACSGPLQYAQQAGHFREVRQEEGWGRGARVYYEPCEPDAPGATPGSMLQMAAEHGADAVSPLPVGMADFEAALRRVPPSIKQQEMEILDEVRESQGAN